MLQLRDVMMYIAVIVLICFTELLATPVTTKDFIFPDTTQAEFVQGLTSYEIAVPVKVNEHGHFESHTLEHSLNHYSSRRYRRDTATQDDTTLHYKVTVEGLDLHLKVTPSHKMFAPGLVFEHRRGQHGNHTNARITRVLGNRCHFEGEIKGHPGSQVALATCNGLHGLLRTRHEDYFIEPVKGHDRNETDKHPHLIYKRSALKQQDDHSNHHDDHDGCGVDGETDFEKLRERWEKHHHHDHDHAKSAHHRSKRSISLERNVETLVVVDNKMMQYYDNEDVENYVLTIMNIVRIMYHDSTIGNAINIVLVRIMFLEEEEKDLTITHHADNSLASFCKWQQTINPKDEKHPNHHDVAILLTRKDICSRMNEPCSTLGLSQVSGMCQPHRSCSINEDTGLALAFTVTHELGHNFGMQHDGVHNGCEAQRGKLQLIMAPQLNAEASPMIWSNCSRESITRFLDRDWGYCLDDEPSEHDFEFPVLPPGVMYDVDHQCRLQYGPDAELCEGIDELCMTLWCRVDNKCVTRLEAAAEGTLCGSNEWCFAGRCEMIGMKPEAIDGQWGQWGAWSECSRSCGAGVSFKQRHCDNPPPSSGGRYCLGERKRYRICNTDNCPDSGVTFREVQCSDFNSIPYKGTLYEWEPISTPATPCQLHCKPVKRFFSVMLKDMVVDGTPCRSSGRDMCISGRCRHVGCDWVIDSAAKEDRCGMCHGDGSTCQTIQDEFNEKEGVGYVEAKVIPSGARNIRVEEVAEANNFLAVKNEKGHYYFNGHWVIQWSGDYKAAGTIIHYERNGNLETFSAPGPLKEPLHIMLLFMSENPGVEFEYTVPNENSTNKRIPIFHWKYMDWTHCTSSCGGGVQRSEVVCVEQEAGIVESHYCNASSKPDDMQKSCNEHICPAKWWVGPWQHCSVTCGPNGYHKRTVICIRSVGPDEQIALEDDQCEGVQKPAVVEPCHFKEPCPKSADWKTGEWTGDCTADPCSVKTREVVCSDDNAVCDPKQKPKTELKCTNMSCGVWHPAAWSQCTRSCGGGIRFRSVICIGGHACRVNAEPVSQQDCNMQPCPTGASAASGGDNHLSVDAPTPAPPHTEIPPLYIHNDLVNVHLAKKLHEKEGQEGNGVEENGNGPAVAMTTETPVKPPTTIHRPTTTQTTTTTTQRPTTAPTTTTTTSTTPSTTTTTTTASTTTTPTTTTTASTTTTTAATTTTTTTTERPTTTTLRHTTTKATTTPRTTTTTKVPTTTQKYMDDVDMFLHDESSQPSPPAPGYQWIPLFWSKCSKPCGAAVQTRKLMCYETNSMEEVDSHLCDAIPQPAVTKDCDNDPCLSWQVSDWSKCTVTCGSGVQTRFVECPESDRCDPDEKPDDEMTCDAGECRDLEWVEGPWSECTKSCGGGEQARYIQCMNRVTKQTADGCDPSKRLVDERKCNEEACPVTSTESPAGTFVCRSNALSYPVCHALQRMGRCRVKYVQMQCCRTCRPKHHDKSAPLTKS